MTTTRKPPRQSLARLIARPGRAGEVVFDLPSRALSIGDPMTDFGGRVVLGVDHVSIFLLDVGSGEDTAAIVVRVRPSVAVRWEIGPSGGVDSGVFGVWDADSARTGGRETDVFPGACVLGGRRVFVLETGDGGFPCVLGRDEQGEIAALLAGPGVDPARFRAIVRDEDLSPAERAELAAKEARAKRLAEADLLGAALGEERASPPPPLVRGRMAGEPPRGGARRRAREDPPRDRGARAPRDQEESQGARQGGRLTRTGSGSKKYSLETVANQISSEAFFQFDSAPRPFSRSQVIRFRTVKCRSRTRWIAVDERQSPQT